MRVRRPTLSASVIDGRHVYNYVLGRVFGSIVMRCHKCK